MLFLLDLLRGNVRVFKDREDFVRRTRAAFLPNFTDLNMTGKDLRVGMVELFVNQNRVVQSTYYVPRRYQVRDEFQRTIDVRDWDEWDKPTPFSSLPRQVSVPRSGSKRNRRRAQGPAMARSSLRGNLPVDWDEVEEAGFSRPVIDHTRPRTQMDKADVWDFGWDKMGKKYASSKCWKDQRKSRYQWKPVDKRFEYA